MYLSRYYILTMVCYCAPCNKLMIQKKKKKDIELSNSITLFDSIEITKFVDNELLAEKLYEAMVKSFYKYNVNQSNSELVLISRV